MKTLIAAVIASAVSFGAFAQTSPATGASTPMASSKMAGDSSTKSTKSTTSHKTTKTHAAKKSSKKASAPAA